LQDGRTCRRAAAVAGAGRQGKVAKVNVDKSPEIAARYGVRSIPSLLLFKGGREIGRTVGAAPKEAYARFIEQTLPLA
jgi:thioredoxin 1